MTAVLLRPPSWAARAACDGLDPAPWDGDRPDLLEQARQVCASCPVVERCLDDALARGEAYGVYGGLTPGERANVARLRGLPRPSPAGRWQHGTPAGVKAHGCGCDPCKAAHRRDVARWRAQRATRTRPATSRGLLIAVLDQPAGTGRSRAFPGQLYLPIGATA